MKTYNKLVRDNIPQILEEAGKTFKSRILSLDEYKESLREKLQEEVEEYLESQEPQELADVLEVIYALAETSSLTPQQLEAIKQEKAKERGGFRKRILLESVD